jgi:hypothetical protein
MTAEQLLARSKDQLAEMARKCGVAGWQSMRKDELIKALIRSAKRRAKASANGKPASMKKSTLAAKPVMMKTPVNGSSNGKHHKPAPRPQRAAARDTSLHAGNLPTSDHEIERSRFGMGHPTKDLSALSPKSLPAGYAKDRLVVMVRDPYWLHCYWELTHQSVQRAEAALGQDWHGAKPILRVCDVSTNDTTSTAEAIVRDIEIHGGCNSWYIEVKEPPRSYRVDIGYLSRQGRFYALARSNVVNTPRAGVSDQLDENWADFDPAQADRIVAMSSGFDPVHAASGLELKELLEQRLRRPIGPPSATAFGTGATPPGKNRKFFFQLDAELIVYGSTEPRARVTLQGEPVKLRPDGTFTMRFSLPDGRQIIPAIAASADGAEERTIVLAVERNTKALEPMVHEIADAAN